MSTLPTLPFSRLLLVSAVAIALSACGGGGHRDEAVVTPAPPPVVTGDVFVLTASNRLLSFDRAAPGTIRSTVAVTGLQAGENLLGIDFRPADGQLYGVGSTGRLYTLNGGTGVATVKASLAADAADTTAPYTALAGTAFGVDFNPVADRLRIVSNTGQSLRINADTGATTTDGSINGGAGNTAITAAAYTNSFAGTASTTLFVIDAANATLYTQNPPNNGTLAGAAGRGGHQRGRLRHRCAHEYGLRRHDGGRRAQSVHPEPGGGHGAGGLGGGDRRDGGAARHRLDPAGGARRLRLDG